MIFDNRGGVDAHATTYHDERTDKDYPKNSTYVFHDGDRTVEFDVEWTEIIEVRDMYGGTGKDHYGLAGEQQRKSYDTMGIKPSYMRYYATGTLKITDADGATTERGDMIYEFNYPGVPDPRARL